MKERINIIENIINGSANRLRESYFIKNDINIYNEIINYTKDINDIKFPLKIWHWVNNINSYVTCYCGKRLSSKMNWRDGYKDYCSNKCSANSELTQSKTKYTIQEKYGVSHYSKTNEYVEKVKNTCIQKYGVDNYSKTKEYLNKSKNTYINKYGVDNYTKTKEYLNKSKITCLNNWGVEYPTQSNLIKNKIKLTNINKYKNTHIFMSNEYRNSNFKISKNPYYLGYFNNENLFKCDYNKEHTFKISTCDYYGRTKTNIPLCTICNPIGDQKSIKEKDLLEFIKDNYNGEIISGYRDVLKIDIYLPELKVGFEFNGLYWHSELFKDKNYHLNKTNHFKDKDIRIIHIWEDDWTFKQEIVKSQIKNWLKITSKKIYARQTTITILKDSKKFLNENHIQGSDRSNIKIGLLYNNELVSIMTFNKSEGRKVMGKYEWNLSRFCNKINTNIVGSASKLLSYFIKEYDVTRIISYADKDWSIGELYTTLKFKLIIETKPDYKYIINNNRIHKSRYRKSKLNTTLTESQYMRNINISKIWDCGKIKFERILK